MSEKSPIGEVRRGRESKLAGIPDDELKETVHEYGPNGSVEVIWRKYNIKITPKTVLNEYKRRFGHLPPKMNIRDRLGRLMEFLINDVLKHYGFNTTWVGNKIGGGVDVVAESNGKMCYFECKNWRKYDRKMDKHIVEREIVSRFRNVENGEKFVVFTTKQEFTPNAEKLLNDEDIEVINVGDDQIKWKNWGKCFRKALKVFGKLFGKIVYVMDFIIDKIRWETFILVNLITEFEVYNSIEDGGGGQSGVKSGLKSILKGCGKVVSEFKDICVSIGKNVASKLVGSCGSLRAFVLDEAGTLPANKRLEVRNLGSEENEVEKLVDRLMNGVAALSNSIGELIEAVRKYNGEVGRLERAVKKIGKMNREIRNGVRRIRKRHEQRHELKKFTKMALEGEDMGEIIKKLDNIGKIRRLERELEELEKRSNMTVKEALKKALAGRMTIGELDEIQRGASKKARLEREIAILEKEGEAGRKRRAKSEFYLVEVR